MAYSFKDASGSTQSAASDVVSSVNYPYIKIIDGTAGNNANVAAVTSGSALKVDGSAVTQPISASSLPLPTGAATAAKQPALGTAGASSADVISIQGVASMTPVQTDLQKVAGSAIGTGHGTAAGVIRVELPTDGTGVVGLNAGTNTIGAVNVKPTTSGGLSMTAGSIGATKTVVNASAGQLYGWYFYNSNASVAYVQIFNAASGSVTLGSTTPDLSFGIPATSAANLEMTNGIAFGTAITIAITTTRTGSTGPSSTVDYNIFYK